MIAVWEEWETCDGGVIRSGMLLIGPAPVPQWDSRGKYLHRKLLHRSYNPCVVPTIDVGFDIVSDRDWITSGGLDQNKVCTDDGELLDYSRLFRLPQYWCHESSSDEVDSEVSEGEKQDLEIAAYNQEMVSSAKKALQMRRRVYNPNKGGSSASISKIADRIMVRLDHASKELFNVSLQELPPASPESSPEKHDSDISLDASNNLLMESLHRFLFSHFCF